MSPDPLAVGLQVFAYAMLLQAAGIAVFSALFGRRLPRSVEAIRRLGRLSALAAAVLLGARFALEPAQMADDWSGIFDASLQHLVFVSPLAAVLVARLLGLCLVALALSRNSRVGRFASVAGPVLISLSFTLSGHTATHAARVVLAPLLALHVLIVSFWFGSLLPLYIATSRERTDVAAKTITAFSALATWLVPAIAVAGLVMTVTLVSGLGVFRQPYGESLIAKIVGFSVLMVLAAINKWKLGAAIGTGDRRAASTFRIVLVAEHALIAAVLVVTVIMTTLYSPAMP